LCFNSSPASNSAYPLEKEKKTSTRKHPLNKKGGALDPRLPLYRKVEKERRKSPPPLNFIKEGKSDPF
jgi:hypothetical protein